MINPKNSVLAFVHGSYSILGATGALVLAILAIWIGSSSSGPQIFTGKVADIIPSSEHFPDWKVAERAIAETPEMQRAVAELLNFEQGVYREFENGSVRVSIYLTYWSPGRMSQRAIAGHTPDICWVAVGWQNLLDDARGVNFEVPVDGVIALELRAFRMGHVTEYVAYGHYVGGEPVLYENGQGPAWHAFVQDLVRRGFSQRGEQFFIRISSNRPIAEVLESGPVRDSLRNLAAAMGSRRKESVR